MKDMKAIISDIDGTVLNDQHKVDEELIALIPQLQEREIPFVLASARSPLGMEPIAQALGLKEQPIAAYNGALVQLGQKVLFEHPVNKAEIRQVISLLTEEFPAISVNIYSAQDWLTNKLDKWSQIEADITGEKPQICPLLDPVLDLLRPIHKLLLIGDRDLIQQAFQRLQELNLDKTTFYLSKDNYLEVTAQQVSKELALKEIARYYDLPLENTMAIGDNFNDIPMIQLAGLGVAMANAPAAVKDQADAVTLSNNQAGVARAIEDYVLKES